ncbi:MAG TPA: ATP-binding protein [Terriglobia bacterium]|nr:ATP-binding protein [Terriglobia bacterium]
MPILPATRQECSAPAQDSIGLDRNSLAQAFESFTHAAGSLENSYTMLQGELARLRRELEVKNWDLASSLAENQRMQAHLSSLLEDLPCAVLAVDARFHLRFANPRAATLLVSRPGERVASGASIPESLRSILKEVVSEPPGTERIWAFQAHEGSNFIAVTCATRTHGVSAAEEWIFILRDVTEQKRLEAEHESVMRMKALAEMTALLAHEIRNPLGSLELFAGLIKDATRDQAEVSQWIVHLQAGLRALSATVNNVLHFYSVPPSQLAPLDVIRLLAKTVEFLQPLALQRGMGIEFTEAGKECLIAGDAYRLQQVFFNLAINAFRAMSAGKRLKIRATVEQQNGSRVARIDFEDEGVGISPADIERVFEAGFTTVKSSPGLGLAVCQRVTSQHKGTIKVRSTQGQGATFSLYFPVLGARHDAECFGGR